MDTSVTENHSIPSPFRSEVPIEKFEEIEKTREDMEKIFEWKKDPEDKTVVAKAMGEYIFPPDKPNEVKLEAFKRTYDLIEDTAEAAINADVMGTLIDMIRAQREPGMRIRLASILSHGAQEDLFIKKQRQDSFDKHAYDILMAKRAAIYLVMNSKDERYSQAQKNWAKTLLNPSDTLSVFNRLYDADISDARKRGLDDGRLRLIPHIIEEITDESFGEKDGNEPIEKILNFTGELVRLKPPALPTFEKLRQFKEMTRKDLPLFITRHEGEKYVHIQFPADLTERGCHLAKQFRDGEITRQQVFEGARELEAEFLARMSPEQSEQLQNNNIEVRYSTERDRVMSNQRKPDLVVAA